MANITAKLIGVQGTADAAASVDIMLCGYGSRSPVGDDGCFASVELDGIKPDSSGEITVVVIGNDVIAPAGTYYTVTFRDDNGDVLQCNAYLFLDSGSYDLAIYPPFDPTQPPPPLPPLIVPQLLIIPPSATPNFPGDQYTAWGLQLNQDVTSSTLSGIVQGNLYTFIITQGGSGNYKFVWPTTVLDPMPVNPTPGGATTQTFVAIANGGPLLPIAAGTWY